MFAEGEGMLRAIGTGLNNPPRGGESGLLIWEGRVWLEGDAGAPHDDGDTTRWRNGKFFDGTWRKPNETEWILIRRSKPPW